MILFLDSIPTPYLIHRYNILWEESRKNILVWFECEKEKYRDWNTLPKSNFPHTILQGLVIPFLGKDILSLRVNTRIKAELKQLKNIERIVICGWDSLASLELLLYAKKHSIPVTLWSGSTEHEKSFIRSIFNPYVKWFVNQFDDYISYGSLSTEYLRSLGVKNKTITPFFNSIDNEYFINETKLLASEREKLREKYGYQQKDILFIANGRLVEVKNYHKLLDASVKIAKKHPNFKLIILGDGYLRNSLEQRVSNELRSAVRIEGYVQHMELPKYYLMSDTLILASTKEVWGLVVNEAMAASLPVLVSKKAGCVKDLVKEGENGISFTPDTGGIETALETALHWSSKKREEMGRHSLTIVQELSAFTSAKKLLKLWGNT